MLQKTTKTYIPKFNLGNQKACSMYILLTGHSASGKDVLANYLNKKIDIKSITISNAIDLLGVERGLITKEQMGYKPTQQKLGVKFRAEEGPDCFLKKIIEVITKEKIYIINGLRAKSELEFFKSNLKKNSNDTKIILIGVKATPENRFQRRLKQGRVKTREEFQKRDAHPAEKEIPFLINQADYKIENNTSIEDFYQKIDLLYSKIL